MSWKGPTALLVAWVIHDLEEALAFPDSCDRLADLTGIEGLRMTPRQSWTAVGLMGILVTSACLRGVRTRGDSAIYRAVAAGLEAHVATHLGVSAVRRGYTAGVVTALPIMLPGALTARRELGRDGLRLTFRDAVHGAALLLPVALASQSVVRLMPPGPASARVTVGDWSRSAEVFVDLPDAEVMGDAWRPLTPPLSRPPEREPGTCR